MRLEANKITDKLYDDNIEDYEVFCLMTYALEAPRLDYTALLFLSKFYNISLNSIKKFIRVIKEWRTFNIR